MNGKEKIDFAPVMQSFDAVVRPFFGAVSPSNVAAHGDALRELMKLFVAVSEAKTRIEAMPLKQEYLRLIERFLSANGNVAGEDEANALRRFANDHVTYLCHATRVIHLGQSVADRFDVVVVKLGNATVRWQRQSNERDCAVRCEQITMTSSSSSSSSANGYEVYDVERDENLRLNHICLHETLMLDAMDSGNDSKFLPLDWDFDATKIRASIGVAALTGISDATLDQIFYGSLAHFYLRDGDPFNYFDNDECVVAVARKFIKGGFLNDDDDDDDDETSVRKRSVADVDDDNNNNDDDDDDNNNNETKRLKTST